MRVRGQRKHVVPRASPYLPNFAEEAAVGDVPVGGTVENLQTAKHCNMESRHNH